MKENLITRAWNIAELEKSIHKNKSGVEQKDCKKVRTFTKAQLLLIKRKMNKAYVFGSADV